MSSLVLVVPRRRARAGRMAAAVLAAVGVALSVLLGAPAVAAGDDGGTVTWSVRPADESGSDGRSWVEQELDPGESAVEHLAVRNLSDEDVTFRLSAADGYFRDNGRFSMLPSGEESVDAGLWIDVEEEVAVAAGETVVVPFTTTVPMNATPGDHAAGIAASILSEQIGQDGASVGVESRVGFRVMTRVTGEIAPSASVEGIHSDYDLSWNPFAPGSARVGFEVVNTGNTRLVVAGTADAADKEVAFPDADEIDQELLPGDRRTFAVDLDGVWPTIFVPASVKVSPDVVGESGGRNTEAVSADVGFWAIPWPQLLVLAGLTLLIAAGIKARRRSRRRLELLLAATREEGRREAEGEKV